MYAFLASLEFHNMDPVLFRIGWFELRWYSLAYMAGLFGGWWYLIKLSEIPKAPLARRHADDFVMWATLGVIVGGRLGYVLFYNLEVYMANPAAIFKLWDGGMSFHGGLVGVTLAILWFARSNKLDVFAFADRIACVVPIGLFFGRVANFINGELWGKPSDLPWAMKFPGAGELARHPSQLYEAMLEGLLLFMVLNFMLRKTRAGTLPGAVVGTFWIWYGISRILVEFVREPDEHLGTIFAGASMGQLLSVPMILFGLWLITRAVKVGRGSEQAARKNAS